MRKPNSGFGIIEVVIGAAIVSLALSAVIVKFAFYVRSGASNNSRTKAIALAEEGLEVARALRNQGYSTNIASLTAGSTYRLAFSGSAWQTTTTNTFIDGRFDRTVVFDSVYRRPAAPDNFGSSSPAPKAIDANARKATVTVSWLEKNATTSISVATYLTNLYAN